MPFILPWAWNEYVNTPPPLPRSFLSLPMMKNSRKVLIITYYWPPSGGAGVQRWLKFSKYLPEFGWKPIVYTPENPYFNLTDQSLLKDVHEDVEVIKRRIWEPYRLATILTGTKSKHINTGNLDHAGKKKSIAQRLITYIRANWIVPDPRKYWIKPSVNLLQNLLEKRGVDVIVTTGPPHSMHLIGYNLKKRRPNLKWIADFRDPWSQLDFYDTLPMSKNTRRKHQKLERKVLEQADIVLGTSPSMHTQLEPFDISKFRCITNGFDPDDFPENYENKQDPERINLVHAGLLKSERNPSNLWKALKKWMTLQAEKADHLNIVCAGNVDTEIREQLSNDPDLGKIIDFPGYLERKELQNLYSSADIFLLLVNNTHNSRVNIPGKLFEYIASGKKILVACKKTDDVAKILMDYPNARILEYNDSPDRYLEVLNDLFTLDAKEIPSESIQSFSRQNLTKDLSDLLEDLRTS